MSEGPTWRVTDPAKPYHDERFDEPWMADPIKIGVDHPHYKPPLDPQQPTPIPDASTPVWGSEMGVPPPLDPQQPTPEQIADAARLAADDIALVFRIWPYSNLDPLGSLRMLHILLSAPAPKWTATGTE